jgi:hypothetical protein
LYFFANNNRRAYGREILMVESSTASGVKLGGETVIESEDPRDDLKGFYHTNYIKRNQIAKKEEKTLEHQKH